MIDKYKRNIMDAYRSGFVNGVEERIKDTKEEVYKSNKEFGRILGIGITAEVCLKLVKEKHTDVILKMLDDEEYRDKIIDDYMKKEHSES